MRLEVRVEDPEGAEEVEVIEVFVAVGAVVAEGDPILELATDKANQDVCAPKAGTVTEILVEEGDIISPDIVLAIVETAT